MDRDQEMEQLKTRLDVVEKKLELIQNQKHSFERQYSRNNQPKSRPVGGIIIYIVVGLFSSLAIIGVIQFISGGR